MTSEAQRKAGFLLPDQITGHNLIPVCMLIPDDLDYRAAFRGVVKKLTDPWSWQALDKSEYPRQHEAAAYWRELIHEHLHFGDECAQGAPTVLFDFRDDCILYYSNDAGATWQPVPGWATFAGACFQGIPGQNGLPGEKGEKGDQGDPGAPGTCDNCRPATPAPPITDLDGQKCAVALGYSELLQAWTTHILDVVEAGSTLTGMVGALLGFGGQLTDTVSKVLAVVEYVVDFGAAALRVFMTPAYWDAVECWLYCNLPDDLIVDDTWRDEFRTWLYGLSIPGQFTAFAEDGFFLDGLNRELYAASLSPNPSCAVTCDPCAPDEWCYTWLDGAGLGTLNVTYGTYNSGTDHIDTVPSGTGLSGEAAFESPVFASTEITAIRIWARHDGSTNTATNFAKIFSGGLSGSQIHYQGVPEGLSGLVLYEWEGEQAFTQFSFLIGMNNPAGGEWIEKVEVRGTGVNPFGTDNCT